MSSSVNFISRLERTKNQNISIQKLDSIARALNTATPDIINNAYRFKKVRIVENYDSTPRFYSKSHQWIKKTTQ